MDGRYFITTRLRDDSIDKKKVLIVRERKRNGTL